MTTDAQSVRAMKPSFTFRFAAAPRPGRGGRRWRRRSRTPQPAATPSPSAGTGDGEPLEEPSSVHGGDRRDASVHDGFPSVTDSGPFPQPRDAPLCAPRNTLFTRSVRSSHARSAQTGVYAVTWKRWATWPVRGVEADVAGLALPGVAVAGELVVEVVAALREADGAEVEAHPRVLGVVRVEVDDDEQQVVVDVAAGVGEELLVVAVVEADVAQRPHAWGGRGGSRSPCG